MFFLDFLGVGDAATVAELISIGLQLAATVGQIATIVLLLKGFFNEMILKMVRVISFFVDGVLVDMIEVFYKYFQKIISGNIFDSTLLSEISVRVYLFIGILIFVKIAIAIFKYISNPDDMKESGSKLVKRLVISIVAIAAIPIIFNFAMKLQDAILNDAIIERVIMGNDYKRISRDRDKQGKVIGFTILNGFLTVDEDKETPEYVRAQKYSDPDAIGVKKINQQESGDYVYNYLPVVSTIALLFVLYVLVKSTLEVALRVLKLELLKLIAPFVIAANITSSDDDMVLSRWFKNVFNTYLSIFIKVAELWFIVFIGSSISNGLILQDGNDLFLRTIVYLALFLLIKEMPVLLKQIFNYEDNSDSTKQLLGTLFRGATSATKIVGGAIIGAGIGTIAGAKNSAKVMAKKRTNSKGLGAKKSLDNSSSAKHSNLVNGLGTTTGILSGSVNGAVSGALHGAFGGIKSAKIAGANSGKKAGDRVNRAIDSSSESQPKSSSALNNMTNGNATNNSIIDSRVATGKTSFNDKNENGSYGGNSKDDANFVTYKPINENYPIDELGSEEELGKTKSLEQDRKNNAENYETLNRKDNSYVVQQKAIIGSEKQTIHTKRDLSEDSLRDTLLKSNDEDDK